MTATAVHFDRYEVVLPVPVTGFTPRNALYEICLRRKGADRLSPHEAAQYHIPSWANSELAYTTTTVFRLTGGDLIPHGRKLFIRKRLIARKTRRSRWSKWRAWGPRVRSDGYSWDWGYY